MASPLPPALRHLVQSFTRLPGVGEKTAMRFALHLLSDQRPVMEALSHALAEAAAQLKPCESCGNIAELEPGALSSAAVSSSAAPQARCSICLDSRRDQKQL